MYLGGGRQLEQTVWPSGGFETQFLLKIYNFIPKSIKQRAMVIIRFRSNQSWINIEMRSNLFKFMVERQDWINESVRGIKNIMEEVKRYEDSICGKKMQWSDDEG